jgi:hypothetical protein
MAYDETLAEEVRKALSGLKVEEKRAFGGLAFMVNRKICVSVNNRPDHIMMVRIDPNNKVALKREGAKIAVMRGKEMTGWIFLTKEAIKTEKDFSYWIDLSVAYNKTFR